MEKMKMAEKEYIERGVLLEKVANLVDYCKKHKSVNGLAALFHVFDNIADAPAADVVEVTRCKDCSFYKYGECWNGQWQDYDGNMPGVKENDFCSYGERETE